MDYSNAAIRDHGSCRCMLDLLALGGIVLSSLKQWQPSPTPWLWHGNGRNAYQGLRSSSQASPALLDRLLIIQMSLEILTSKPYPAGAGQIAWSSKRSSFHPCRAHAFHGERSSLAVDLQPQKSNPNSSRLPNRPFAECSKKRLPAAAQRYHRTPPMRHTGRLRATRSSSQQQLDTTATTA